MTMHMRACMSHVIGLLQAGAHLHAAGGPAAALFRVHDAVGGGKGPADAALLAAAGHHLPGLQCANLLRDGRDGHLRAQL